MVSGNTSLVAPNGWAVEIVDQLRRRGFLDFEYQVWPSVASKQAGDPPMLQNNHHAQVRVAQQRIQRGPGGGLLFRQTDTLTVEAPAGGTLADGETGALEAFLAARRNRAEFTQRVGLTGWVRRDGTVVDPFVFARYDDIDEGLDPNWVRQRFLMPVEGQRDELIYRFLAQAEANGWRGDMRGTTYNLAIGADADDAVQTSSVTSLNSQGVQVDTTTKWLGGRFQNVLAGKNAGVTSSIIGIVPSSSADDEPNHPVTHEDADNPGQFVAGGTDLSSRTKTATLTTFASADLGANGTNRFFTSSIHAGTQGIFARAGWAPGNALVIFFQGSATSTRDLANSDYGTNTSLVLTLDIITTEFPNPEVLGTPYGARGEALMRQLLVR